MVALELGRWLLVLASGTAWLLLLDAMALAWPHRDWSDRVLLLFALAAINWSAVFEGGQAWHRYPATPVDLMALASTAAIWAVLGLNWAESRVRSAEPIDGD